GLYQVPLSAAQPGDVLLCCFGSSVPNHAAIYCGDGELLHHIPEQLSKRERYTDKWQRQGLLAVGAGVFTFFWLDDTPEQARFLSKQEKTLLINQLASEEQQKVTSRLSDALRNGRVWQLAIIYLTIQVAVYGLIFF
ncbi:NlpC/P60 family protein, partial [Escherichia coli]|uniref:NlpC/P60 family protein n=1 Tax=Escherichia coli TaxID=562 RepID=UPI002E7626B1